MITNLAVDLDHAESQARLDAYLQHRDPAAETRAVANLELARRLVVGTFGGLHTAVLDGIRPDLASKVEAAIEAIEKLRTAVADGTVYDAADDDSWTDMLPARTVRRVRTARNRGAHARRLALVGAR